MGEKLTREEYDMVVQQCFLIAKLIRDIPTEKVLEMISRSESVGAIFNPTLYRTATPKLEIAKQVVSAINTAKRRLPSMEQAIKADAESDAAARMAGYKSAKDMKDKDVI